VYISFSKAASRFIAVLLPPEPSPGVACLVGNYYFFSETKTLPRRERERERSDSNWSWRARTHFRAARGEGIKNSNRSLAVRRRGSTSSLASKVRFDTLPFRWWGGRGSCSSRFGSPLLSHFWHLLFTWAARWLEKWRKISHSTHATAAVIKIQQPDRRRLPILDAIVLQVIICFVLGAVFWFRSDPSGPLWGHSLALYSHSALARLWDFDRKYLLLQLARVCVRAAESDAVSK
jgi:hypothetical protein